MRDKNADALARWQRYLSPAKRLWRNGHATGSKIEPAGFAIAKIRKTKPVEQARLIAIEIQNDGRGRTVQEVQASLSSRAAQT